MNCIDLTVNVVNNTSLSAIAGSFVRTYKTKCIDFRYFQEDRILYNVYRTYALGTFILAWHFCRHNDAHMALFDVDRTQVGLRHWMALFEQFK
jgi:hypothetical protein